MVDSSLQGLPPAKEVTTSRCSRCDELRVSGTQLHFNKAFFGDSAFPKGGWKFQALWQSRWGGNGGIFLNREVLGCFSNHPRKEGSCLLQMYTLIQKIWSQMCFRIQNFGGVSIYLIRTSPVWSIIHENISEIFLKVQKNLLIKCNVF